MTPSSKPSAGDEKETARVEAFSDGVFAIAITLLVLELKVPHELTSAGLKSALIGEWPSFVAYCVSFVTIGIMWINHHRLFRLIRRVNDGLLAANGLLLLTISVVPFPTALVSAYLNHDGDRLSAAVYCGWAVVIAISFNILWRYAASPARQPPLLAVPHDSPHVRAIHKAYLMGPAWYGIAFALSFWRPTAALAVCGALGLFFLIPPKTPGPT